MSLDFFDYHNEMLRTNAEYKEAYEALEPEFAIVSALIKARSDVGMSQSDVAERLGITQPAVARMESGKNMSIKTLRRYATAVGKPIQIVIQPRG